MKLTALFSVVMANRDTCEKNLPEQRWNCSIDDVTGVNVCTRNACQHNVVYRKGCFCDSENVCTWQWLSPENCPDHLRSTFVPRQPTGISRRKKKVRGCNSFDISDGWHCSKGSFQKNTICHKRCVNFGVAFKRCKCPRGNPKQPCKWLRKTTNKECFKPLKPDQTREMINLSLNQPSKLPSAFLRDFVDAADGLFEYDEEVTTTGATTASTASTTIQMKEPNVETPPKDAPKTEGGLSAAVHKATTQINEWVAFLQELLHFDQLTVISIDSGTMKE